MITRTVRLRRTVFGLTLAMVAGLVPVGVVSAATPDEAASQTSESVPSTDATDATDAPVSSDPGTTTPAPETTEPATTSTAAPATSAPSSETTAPEAEESDSTEPDASASSDTGLEGFTEPDFEPSPAQPDFDPVAIANSYLNGSNTNGIAGVTAIGANYANAEWSNSVMGGYVVRYDQQVQGIPVWGAGAVVRLDENGGVMSVNQDEPTAAPSRGLTPSVSTADASAAAIAGTRAKMTEDKVGDPAGEQLSAGTPVLTVYDASLIGGDPNAERFAEPILVWDISVTNTDHSVAYRNLVDAMTGEAVLSFTVQEHGLNRWVCDAANSAERTYNLNCLSTRTEGQGPVPQAEMNIAYDTAGFYYKSFKNRVGRDSYNGKGARMRTTVRGCDTDDPQYCPMINAFWYGPFDRITIGEGLAVDDVIFHEWTHAVTEYSANLLYYAESGAINESMSDVFGELLDQAYQGAGSYDSPSTNWEVGEGLQLPIPGYKPPLRSMKNPPTKGSPDRIMSKWFTNSPDDNWGVHTNSGVNNKATYLIAAGGSFRGQTIKGIGNSKTFKLYYEVLTGLLTPGSDYLDLAKALPQACSNLVKSKKLSSADCTSVRKAVSVTQMDQARRQRKVAPYCQSGKPQTQFLGDAEGSLGAQFTTYTANGGKAFSTSTIASQSGSRSYYNPEVPNNSAFPTSIMQTRYPVYISKQQPAFLRFDHSLWFGGTGTSVIEYSTDGKKWSDLGTTPGTLNGYQYQVSGGPLAGRKVFAGLSKGFEQVRVPLTQFAGKSVMFRWRYVGSNIPDSASGLWMIDDIRVYTCGASAPTDTGYSAGRFRPVPPVRLFDTRPNQPATLVKVPTRQLNAGEELKIDLTGLAPFAYGDQPTAVALNVTAAASGELNHVTVYPCGSDNGTSTLNFGPFEATANAAIVPITADQKVCFKALKPVDLLADVTGYFATTKSGSTATYRPLSPQRAFDTRDNKGNLFKVPTARVKDGTTIQLPMKNLGIYAKGDTPVAAAVTITAAGSSTIGHVTAYPCANGRPVASSLNLRPGRAVPNSAIVPFDKDGNICIYTVGNTHLLMDISGYFTQGGSGLKFASVAPVRAVDTRGTPAKFDIKGLRAAGAKTKIPMSTLGVYGSNKPQAVVINMTTAGATAPGHANVYPCTVKDPPNTSINNYLPGSARAAGAIATLGDGDMCAYNFKPVQLVVDVSGYFY